MTPGGHRRNAPGAGTPGGHPGMPEIPVTGMSGTGRPTALRATADVEIDATGPLGSVVRQPAARARGGAGRCAQPVSMRRRCRVVPVLTTRPSGGSPPGELPAASQAYSAEA